MFHEIGFEGVFQASFFVLLFLCFLKQLPSRICDFRLLLLTSREPSTEHPQIQILVLFCIDFEVNFQYYGVFTKCFVLEFRFHGLLEI